MILTHYIVGANYNMHHKLALINQIWFYIAKSRRKPKLAAATLLI